MKIPPVLSAPQGSPADQATQDLIEGCKPLGMYIAAMPDSPERAAALQHFNECLLWVHQAILRACGTGRVVVADSRDLQKP